MAPPVEPLADAGYHVLAPDQRGYGRSSRPDDVAAYGTDELSADLLGLLDATGHDDAVFVGHDWGALLVWDLARLHPGRVRGIVNASVPYTPWPMPPTELFKATAGDGFFYILYFQPVGPAETELEADVERTMRTLLWAASGEAFPDEFRRPAAGRGHRLHRLARRAGPPPDELPAWLTEADVDTYVAAFEASGFFGPLSWYRNLDANHERDEGPPGPGGAGVVHRRHQGRRDRPHARATSRPWPACCPTTAARVMIDGAGHWTQQEAPEEFNQALLAALDDLHRPAAATAGR